MPSNKSWDNPEVIARAERAVWEVWKKYADEISTSTYTHPYQYRYFATNLRVRMEERDKAREFAE